jgi:hypothetical protein
MLRFFFAFLIVASSFGFQDSPVTAEDCSILHEGTFEYGPKDDPVKVIIKKDKHVEYHNGGKYVLKSSIKWTSDCSYTATLLKVTIPDFPFKIGTQLNVQINKVENDEVFYTAEVNGDSWNGKFTKIK